MRLSDQGSVDSASRPGRSSTTWVSLHYPEYRNLFVGGLLIFASVQAQQVARGQIAYDLSGSNKGLGGVYLGFGVPMLLLTPFGGVFADRFPKRTVLLMSQSALLGSAAWIAAASAFNALEYWMLVGAAAIQGAGFATFGPARAACTGELVPRHLLANAVALTQVSLNATGVVGPAMAGVLISIESFGPTGVYFITTALMALSIGVVVRLPKRTRVTSAGQRSIAAELGDGITYARRHPVLGTLIVTATVVVMSGWPYLAFLPALSHDRFGTGAWGLGVMSSVSAAAALATTLWIARRSSGRLWGIQIASGIALALGLLGVAAAPNFAFGLIALFVVGGAASGFQSANSTIALSVTDVEYHGRVQSLLLLSFSGFGIAALPLGIVADAVGLQVMLTVMGSTCLATMGIYILVRRRWTGATAELRPPGRRV